MVKVQCRLLGFGLVGLRQGLEFLRDEYVRKLLRKMRMCECASSRRFLAFSSDGLVYTGYDSSITHACRVGKCERIFLRKILELVRKCDSPTFIDVGAGVGLYTIRVGKILQDENRSGRVIACEPDPRQFLCLVKNVRLNKLRNVIPLKVALGDYVGSSRLAIYDIAGWSSLYNIHAPTRKVCEVTVQVTTLDNIVQELGLETVTVVKIDVEGAEYHVLKGARKVLQEHAPTLLIEVHGRENLYKIRRLLQEHDYVLNILGVESRFTDIETFYTIAHI